MMAGTQVYRDVEGRQKEGKPQLTKEEKAQRKKEKTAEYYRRLRTLHDEHNIPSTKLEKIEKIGEGGFSTVDLCWLTKEDGSRAQVAVKRVRPDVLKHSTQLKLFTNESEILVKLKHKCIVNLIGLGSVDDSSNEQLRDTFYLVEELVDGGSLRLIVLHQMIHAPHQLYRIRDAARWCLQMAQALSYLHGLNPVVVHRDLKPDNVLLTCLDPWEADIKLADFGLSVMIPNKHVAAERQKVEAPARNPAREARWVRSMAPHSNTSITGAAAMLHMVETQSMTQAMEAASPINTVWTPSIAGNQNPGLAAHVAANGNGAANGHSDSLRDMHGNRVQDRHSSGRHSSGGRGQEHHSASAGSASRRQYTPFNSRGVLPPTSRLNLGLYSPGSKAGGLYSTTQGVLHSRASTAPRSGVLRSRLGLTGTQRVLECPSGIMFDLTSMTGSLLYMAPEVFKGQPYNYKADTFSFGVLVYELLHQRLIMASLIAQQIEDRHSFENEIMEFTKCVSAGFRPPIEEWLPDYMRDLITACWAQSPTDRPNMQHVVGVLQHFLSSPELAQIDKDRSPSCCQMC